jgi:hypothetical protein
MNNNELANHSQEIIDLFERYGWIRHQPGSEGVGFCLYGACAYLGLSDYEFLEELAFWLDSSGELKSLKAIRFFSRRGEYHILPGDCITWNDYGARDQDHVIEVLRDFIANLKGRESDALQSQKTR